MLTPPSDSDRLLLRDLAQRVAEIAADPVQEQKRRMWYRHNALQSGRPLVLVFPEGAWEEILPGAVCECGDPHWRGVEWGLRAKLLQWAHFPDDNPVEAELAVPRAVERTDWGVPFAHVQSDTPRGSFTFDPPLKDPGDISRLRYPTISHDAEETQRWVEVYQETFGDLLRVSARYGEWTEANLAYLMTELRGLDQMMVDMCDRPAFVHELAEFLTAGLLKLLDERERQGLLSLNNGGHYVGSGGVGYTHELPAADFDGTHVRPRDLWGFGEAQELALVSPEMHDEFVLQYQIRILERYGLNCYGCCEDTIKRFEVIRRVPRLRRISVCPWADTQRAAETLQDRYVFSWKPNPAMVAGERLDTEWIRTAIGKAIGDARGCVLEMILKDTHTVRGELSRFTEWTRIVLELAEEAAGM